VVKALVLISPGLDYKGLIPSQAIIDYTHPALLITTQDDAYSYQSTERLYNWLLGLKSLQVYKKIGDGTDMLSHQSALGENMTEWLIKQMPSPAAPTHASQPAAIKPEGQAAVDAQAQHAEGKTPATAKAVEKTEKPLKAQLKPVKKPQLKKLKAKPAKKANSVKQQNVKKPEPANTGQPPIPGG
jgi:hypothetical protein